MKKSMKKHAKLVAAVTLAASMIAVPSVFALNSAGDGTGNGNKPFSFTGYRYQDNSTSADTLELYFNKETASPGETTNATDLAKMFTVKNAAGTSKSFTVVTPLTQTGNYDGSSWYSKGTKVVLQFSSELNDSTDANTLYSVEIDNKFMDKNGLTVGNYADRENLKFYFQVPDNSGAYTGNPYVTYFVGDPTDVDGDGYPQNVSWESDLTVVFDRPMYASQVSTYKTDMNGGYEKYNTGNSTWEDVALSDGSTGTYEAYQVKSNDTGSVNTVFFFPETCNTSTTPVFNRTNSSNQYRLTLPTNFYDVNNRQTTAYSTSDDCPYGGSLEFTTTGTDYPGWENNGNPNTPLTVTVNGSTTTLSWAPSTINNAVAAASNYDVYYTTGDKFTGAYTKITSGITYTTGTPDTAAFTTPAGAAYYRVVPNNGTHDVGFSIANS